MPGEPSERGERGATTFEYAIMVAILLAVLVALLVAVIDGARATTPEGCRSASAACEVADRRGSDSP